jgi:uncharacterized protein DUF6236
MSTYQALYYPFIHFKHDGWVKLAALYWDNLGRIVPNDYVTDDSETVKALGSFVEILRPDAVGPEFGKPFVDFIAQYGPKLSEKYALSLRKDWPALPETQRPPRPGGPSGSDPRLGYIYYAKISDDVYLALKDSKLASTDDRGSSWIGMHPRLAWVYMTALAEHVSGKRGLRPLTDDTRDHVALSGLSTERLAQALLEDVSLVDAKPTATEIETILVSVAFRAIVPKDLAGLSVDKILAFREKYPKERASFQEAVAELLKSREWLASISDRDVLEQRLRDEYDKIWAAKLEELREKLTEVGIDTMWSCFNVKGTLPAGVAGAAAALALALNPIAAATAAVALGVIPVLRDKHKAATEALKASPMSFLYRMEQDLKPMDLWSKVKQRSLQFTLGI